MAKKIIGPFRFKRFDVRHVRSAHKVGVDGVLVALWTPLPSSMEPRILDVGCGSGVISLILAQRLSEIRNDFRIEAIDIDTPSVEEARENFMSSPWRDKLAADKISFAELPAYSGFDLVVSNPPYFDSGLTNPETRRERARHQGSLSPESLIERAKELLTPNGRLTMIVPAERVEDLKNTGLHLCAVTWVKGHPDAPTKRALLEFARTPEQFKESALVLETAPGVPTDEYRDLGKDFYLYF